MISVFLKPDTNEQHVLPMKSAVFSGSEQFFASLVAKWYDLSPAYICNIYVLKAFHPPLSCQCNSPVGGSTELWGPLRALSLLPPSCGIRNLLLLSDGHIQNAELTLQLLRDNSQHSRLFTCGLRSELVRGVVRILTLILS